MSIEESSLPLAGRDIATLTPAELVTEVSRLLSTIADLQRENERLRQFLFPYADRTDISGISWDGKYLIGDKASISAFREMQNRGLQIDVYKRAYDQNEAALKGEAEYLRGVANDIQKGYIEATKRAEEAVKAANALQARTDTAEADVKDILMSIETVALMAEQGVLSADGGQAAVEIRSLIPVRFRTYLTSTGGEHHADK